MKKVTAAASAIALAGVMAVGAAVPAQAGNVSECMSTYFCGWWDIGYNGTGPQGSAGSLWFVGAVPNDQWSSVYNRGVQSNVRAYADWNWTGASIFVGRGTAISDLRPSGFNDRISSFEWL